MAKYLFIESRDAFDCRDCEEFLDLVEGVAKNGNEVTLFLVQNGVLPLRRNSRFSRQILQLMKNKVNVAADGFSLRERGITDHDMLDDVAVKTIDDLANLLLQTGTKNVWH